MKRRQIHLDDQQDEVLAQHAKSQGRTKSDLIREAVSAYLTDDPAGDHEAEMRRFRETIRRVAGSAPYLPPGDVYVREFRKADVARQDALEKRWRG